MRNPFLTQPFPVEFYWKYIGIQYMVLQAQAYQKGQRYKSRYGFR